MASPIYLLYHTHGASSTYTLALLHLFGIPHTVKMVCFDSGPNGVQFESEESKEVYMEMKSLNPLAQFPTLVKVDGDEKVVMTEAAAIALYLHDKYAAGTPWSTASLTDVQLAMFYRLTVFIPANLISTLSIVRFPERHISVPSSCPTPTKEILSWVESQGRENIRAVFLTLEKLLESAEQKSVYALGTTNPTLVDVYICFVSHYSPQPRHSWLETNCPRIYACTRETLKHPVLRKTFFESRFEDPLTEP